MARTWPRTRASSAGVRSPVASCAVRVVSFNIHHGTVGTDGPVDPEQLGEVCLAFEADVICLQEVDRGTKRSGRRDLAAIAARGCGMDHVFGPSTRLGGGHYGNATLVRGEIRWSRVVRLPRVPRVQLWQERRTLLQADVHTDHGSVQVWNVHLAAPSAIQAAQFATLLRRAGHVEVPLVVAGDFNRLGGAVLPQAAQVGLAAADHGPTFPAHPPRSDIDHVLVSEHFGVQRSEVVPTAMSDHAALVVDLGLRP